jgi:hypothetical protein
MSHYDWLKINLPTIFAQLNLLYPLGIITAHGDKAYSYRETWEKAGIHFFHGVAIYLLSYVRPFSNEVRETANGWVDVCQWVIDNKDRFIPKFPAIS